MHTWGHVTGGGLPTCTHGALLMLRGGSRILWSWGEYLVQLPHLLSMGLKLRARGLQPMTINKVTRVAGATGY